MFVFTFYFNCQGDLALMQPTRQSSTLTLDTNASLAVANFSGYALKSVATQIKNNIFITCSVTGATSGVNSWWSVDLGAVWKVEVVVITTDENQGTLHVVVKEFNIRYDTVPQCVTMYK